MWALSLPLNILPLLSILPEVCVKLFFLTDLYGLYSGPIVYAQVITSDNVIGYIHPILYAWSPLF